MIDSVEGVVAGTEGGAVRLTLGPVTLSLPAPASTTARLRRGEEALLHTHLLVREDDLKLFGFGTVEERELFRLLIGVNNVGPSTALALLSARSAEDVQTAIAREDRKFFVAIKGIGPKTAERILLELRGKVAAPAAASRLDGTVVRDAVDALVALGQAPAEAEAAVGRVLQKSGPGGGAEALVREALRETGKG